MNYVSVLFLVCHAALSVDQPSLQTQEELARQFKAAYSKSNVAQQQTSQTSYESGEKVFSHWCTICVWFYAQSPFWSIVGGVGACTSTVWCLKSGHGVTLAHTEPQAQIRRGGREKRVVGRANMRRERSTRGKKNQRQNEWVLHGKNQTGWLKVYQSCSDGCSFKVEIETKLDNWEKVI